MGEILRFTAPKEPVKAPRVRMDNTSNASVVSLNEVAKEVLDMISLIFSLQLISFFWGRDWWWLKFQYSESCHREVFEKNPALVRIALNHIHAFYFEKVFESFEDNQEEDQKKDFFTVSEVEGWELNDDSLGIFFRTHRSTARRKKLVKAAPADYDSDEDYIFVYDEYWADMKLGEEEKYRMKYFFSRVK